MVGRTARHADDEARVAFAYAFAGVDERLLARIEEPGHGIRDLDDLAAHMGCFGHGAASALADGPPSLSSATKS